MKITQIFLEDGKPVRVVASMSITEAAVIAKLVGKLNHLDATALLPGGGEAVPDIYEGLTGELFNRFWDSGVDGCIRGDDE